MVIRGIVAVGLLLLSGSASTSQGWTVYYRVGSTQQTVIVGAERREDDDWADITWTNAHPDSVCTVESTYWLNGPWTTNFYATNVVTEPLTVTKRVPTPDRPPRHTYCIHNLYQIHLAKECTRVKYGLEEGEFPTVSQLIDCGLKLYGCVCPDGGTYFVNEIGVKPTCTYVGGEWPHVLP